jgi:two-component system chemotaxis sensor kinase CheA
MAIPPDMRDMFAAECGDYLVRLAGGFLALESAPGDPATVDALFRVAHSLKGTARIMDCMDLHRAAHGLEELLVQLRDGQTNLSPAQFDGLSEAMDRFQELLRNTLEDNETASQADAILGQVQACLAGPAAMAVPAPAKPATAAPAKPAPTTLAAPAKPAPTTLAAPAKPAPAALPDPPARPPTASLAALPSQPLDVLKVPIAKLDALINQVGELLVAHQRLAGHAEASQALGDLLEEAARRTGGDRQVPLPLVQKAQHLAQNLGEEEARLARLFESLETAIQRTRMVPLSVLLDQAPKWVRDAGRALGKTVRLEVAGAALELDKQVVEGLRDPLMHLLRNAVDHGIETPPERRALGKPEQGLLTLRADLERDGVQLVLEDDGTGLDYPGIRRTAERQGLTLAAEASREELIRLLYRPGFSTRERASEFSGRGVGLDVVASQVTLLNGTLQLTSEPGRGTQVRLWLPQSLSRVRALAVQAAGLGIGLPSSSVRACLQPAAAAFQFLEGRPVVVYGEEILPLIKLGSLLGRAESPGTPVYVVLLEAAGATVALGVDAFLEECEVMQKPLPPRLRGLELINGFSLQGNGHILLLGDPLQLTQSARHSWQGSLAQPLAQAGAARVRSILLADDSLTTRVQLRRILESAGYQVQPAVDGLDAWARLGTQTFDAVVSDVQMPGLDGYQLTARIRGNPQLAALPVVLVTTLASEEDQRRGLEVGASAYITKGSFDQEQLLEHLQRLT